MKSFQFYTLALLIMEAPHVNQGCSDFLGGVFFVMICFVLLLQFITKKEL